MANNKKMDEARGLRPPTPAFALHWLLCTPWPPGTTWVHGLTLLGTILALLMVEAIIFALSSRGRGQSKKSCQFCIWVAPQAKHAYHTPQAPTPRTLQHQPYLP